MQRFLTPSGAVFVQPGLLRLTLEEPKVEPQLGAGLHLHVLQKVGNGVTGLGPHTAARMRLPLHLSLGEGSMGLPTALVIDELNRTDEGRAIHGRSRPAAPTRAVKIPHSKTRAQATARYGNIDTSKGSPSQQWPDSKDWIVRYDVPDEIVNDPAYRWTVRGKRVAAIYVNRDLVPMLDSALTNLKQAGLLAELQTYNGSWVIRATRGRQLLSAHSWGIAIDVNASSNRLGQKPTLSAGFVAAFTRAGFAWGGNFHRPDGMHFSLGF